MNRVYLCAETENESSTWEGVKGGPVWWTGLDKSNKGSKEACTMLMSDSGWKDTRIV